VVSLKIGIIGAGGAARAIHLPGFRICADVEIAAVCDADPDAARALGVSPVYTDYRDVLDHAEIGAVVIATPNFLHREMALAAFAAGKHVLCEKPLATTLEDAQAIIEAEQALGRRLISVGFMRRFDPQHVAVKQAVATGQVGRPILFKGVHRNPMILPNVTGPVVVTNSAIHDLDSTRFLLGQEVTEVLVRGVRTHESFNADTLDMLLFSMSLTGNCLATIETSVAVEYGYEVLAEIVGQRGSVITASPADATVRSNKTQAVSVYQSHLDRFQAAFVPEMIDWVRSVQTGQPFAGASAWDGYMASLVAQTCIQSLLSGAPAKVPTPEKPDLYA